MAQDKVMYTAGPWKYRYPEWTNGPVVYAARSTGRGNVCTVSRPNSAEGKLIALAPTLADDLLRMTAYLIEAHRDADEYTTDWVTADTSRGNRT